MKREKDPYKEDWGKWAIRLEQDKEKALEIDQLAFNFEKAFLEVFAGNKKEADLYSGDFVYQEDPIKLILPKATGKVLTADYEELYERFIELIENDFADEEFLTTTLSREPEPRTEHLRNFLKFHKGEELLDSQRSRKLKIDDPNTILLLTVDRYVRPEKVRIPFSETWTLRKMKFDTDGSGGVKPHSMISTQSLPALTPGEII